MHQSKQDNQNKKTEGGKQGGIHLTDPNNTDFLYKIQFVFFFKNSSPLR